MRHTDSATDAPHYILYQPFSLDFSNTPVVTEPCSSTITENEQKRSNFFTAAYSQYDPSLSPQWATDETLSLQHSLNSPTGCRIFPSYYTSSEAACHIHFLAATSLDCPSGMFTPGD